MKNLILLALILVFNACGPKGAALNKCPKEWENDYKELSEMEKKISEPKSKKGKGFGKNLIKKCHDYAKKYGGLECVNEAGEEVSLQKKETIEQNKCKGYEKALKLNKVSKKLKTFQQSKMGKKDVVNLFF